MLQVGDQFAHYEIHRHVAQSAMSDVYAARDLLTGSLVALKIPNGMMIGDPTQHERFKREVEVSKRLEHPAIQRGLDAGRYNRIPYLATQWIEGESLRDLLARRGALSTDDALALLTGLAEGVAYCHEKGIVHRDLKPENVLVTPKGQAVIIDFGLALTSDAHRVTYANLSSVSGTPDYMAPEQIEGQRGDERSDIYALGIILWEMLAGSVPYSGDNSYAVMAQHLRGQMPRLDELVPGLSNSLAAVVARCLQRIPQDRYESVSALLFDLDHPEQVDPIILGRIGHPGRHLGAAWRSQTGLGLLASVIVLLLIFLIAIAAQAIKGAMP